MTTSLQPLRLSLLTVRRRSDILARKLMKTKITNTLMMLAAAMIWGFAIVAQIFGAEHVETFTMTGIRFTLGSLALLPVVIIFERKKLATIFSDKKKRKKAY